MLPPNHREYKRIEGIENAVHNNDQFFFLREFYALSDLLMQIAYLNEKFPAEE